MLVVFAGLGAALVTALVSVYLGKRSTSGNVDTSEAKDLWDSMRSELARLQTDNDSLRAAQAVAATEMIALRSETASVRNQLVRFETLETDLRDQISTCMTEIARISKAVPTRTRKTTPR